MKKIIALVLAMMMVFSLSTAVMAFDEDVDKDLAITRGEFVSVLYRIEGALTSVSAEYNNVFADVDASYEHSNAIAWAAKAGVVIGMTSTTFAPNENVTREQVAAMMYRYYIYKGFEVEKAALNCADAAAVSAYAVDGMAFAVANDMLAVDANNNINPTGIVTGEELREIIGNFYFNEIK